MGNSALVRIRSNTILGPLDCFGNTPAPTRSPPGGFNTATSFSGQCASGFQEGSSEPARPERCRGRMKRILVVTLGLAALLAGPAAAKGPVKATITGPGLDRAIVLAGDAEGNAGSRFGRFVEQSGFFPQVFRQTPDSTSRVRPSGRLGPRYDVVYLVPGPNNDDSTVRQELYPFAAIGPVTYTRPGQPVFPTEGMTTHGGWYRSPYSLRRTLVSLGFPAKAPSLKQSGLGVGAWAGIAAGALALAAATALLIRRRRGSGEAPA